MDAQHPRHPDAHDFEQVLLSETENRYDFGGLILINRETGNPEDTVEFTRDEIDMPGYVESVERGYENTAWRTRRLWPTTGPTA